MSYATVTDLGVYLPLYTISATSKPSTTQATEMLTNCSNEIDAALKSRGLAVPVSAPAEFVTDLTQLNALGAAALWHMSAFPSEAGLNSSGLGARYWQQYQARLKDLRNGLGVPVGVGVAETDLVPRNLYTDSGAIGQTGRDPWGQPVSSEPLFRMERPGARSGEDY